MVHARKKLPAYAGLGDLHFRGFTGPVDYEVLGEAASLKLGPLRLRGSLTTTPEIAADAFREGEGVLTLEDGRKFRITLLGHTGGSGVAYFEMRV